MTDTTATTAAGKLDPVDVTRPDTDDQQLWSVTTIIGALDKPALTYWAANQTAHAAVHQRDAWEGMADTQPSEAVRWLAAARFRTPEGEKTSAELGTAVHAACEEYVLTGTRPEVDADVAPFLDRFDEWCERAQPEYQAAEVTVYHPAYGYAGTCDAFLTVDGIRCIADYKTSREATTSRGDRRRPYPEVALQLAAYRWAEFAAAWRPRRFEKYRRRYYLLSDAERANAVPIPDVDAGLAILITPEFCDAYLVDVSERVHIAFLYVLEAHRWAQETSRTVLAPEPLEID